jgi:uncharacterized membrane protein YeaQ/YmgE (transglycosylase-associated protein family)
MRHLWSFLLSLVLTPLIYVSAGFSAVKFGEATGLGTTAVLGLVGAFVAGGLYALLVISRLSPVGPVFASLVYLGVTTWALVDRASFVDVIPANLFGQANLLHVPVGFGTTLLAAPLLFTVFSPRRWRSSTQPAPAAFDAAPTYSAAAPTAAPTYTDTTTTTAAAAPTYEPSAPVYEPAAPSYGPPTATTFEPPVYTPPTAPASPWPPSQREGDERTGLS